MSNDQSVTTTNKQGAFFRTQSSFRNFIEKGGEFEPEARVNSRHVITERYHLYVSIACRQDILCLKWEVYLKAEPNYSERARLMGQEERNDCNESTVIIRIFSSEFNDILPAEKAAIDLYPKEL
ncbi:hypothetical protein M422DRAFT_260816 [Sphaerobolus stellatus SS14]|uniref:Uncharacterized protein n=1 Tax=Sphaerobolus stellatus (strain SS14) TaxID=990650 RepID=A0A0C9V4V0_SPHS4|nr:hypothetical protein M422DRAFT_260816 [Sphaerobolus stellatus SS14]